MTTNAERIARLRERVRPLTADRLTRPIDIDGHDLIALLSKYADQRSKIDTALALMAPIIERGKGQIGTHSDLCHEYHVGCLAVRVSADLTTPTNP
jgi:hypothetical protein